MTEALKFPADCAKSAPLRRLRASAVCGEQQGPCPGLESWTGAQRSSWATGPRTRPADTPFQPMGSGIPSGQLPTRNVLYTHTPGCESGEATCSPLRPRGLGRAGQPWGRSRASPGPTPTPTPNPLLSILQLNDRLVTWFPRHQRVETLSLQTSRGAYRHRSTCTHTGPRAHTPACRCMFIYKP